MNNNEQSRSNPLFGAVLVAAGTYLMIGFVYVLLQSDWPPFWPPMHPTIAVLELFPQAATIGVALILGTFAVLLGPALFIFGARKLLIWRRETRQSAGQA